MNKAPVLLALASAALFGASTPLGKLLLDSLHPAVLAGLLYCGAGIGVAILRRARPRRLASDAALSRRDLPSLAGAVVCGGLIGPLLLMIGLAQTQASTASLLLAFEGAATAFLAWLFFREQYGGRLILGMALIVAGAMVLTWSPLAIDMRRDS